MSSVSAAVFATFSLDLCYSIPSCRSRDRAAVVLVSGASLAKSAVLASERLPECAGEDRICMGVFRCRNASKIHDVISFAEVQRCCQKEVRRLLLELQRCCHAGEWLFESFEKIPSGCVGVGLCARSNDVATPCWGVVYLCSLPFLFSVWMPSNLPVQPLPCCNASHLVAVLGMHKCKRGIVVMIHVSLFSFRS